MATAGTLDQVVKGAPPPTTSADLIKKENNHPSSVSDLSARATPTLSSTTDPTSLLPSSPPQIYLNLLILEASLRQQYLTLRARKRQHTLVVAGLAVWVAGCFYLQFLAPREDGRGIGGSVYWLVDMAEKVALIGGCVMGALFWATGQWERGMRWPRRWLGTTNRGLRTMNCKIVVLRGPWWRELLEHFGFLLPLQPSTPGSSYHYVEYAAPPRQPQPQHLGTKRAGSGVEWTEEDVAHGGDHVKILLLPKQFTPDFRENWELYRAEYWAAENERRRALRRHVRARDREWAQRQGGWLWWTGWRGWSHLWGTGHPSQNQREATPPPPHVHSAATAMAAREKHRRRPSVKDRERDASHSRSSSRSSVMTNPDAVEARERRWSTASTGSTGEASRRRRSKLLIGDSSSTGHDMSSGVSGGSLRSRPARLTPAGTARSGTSTGSRPSTPVLDKRASTLSTSSTLSDFSVIEGKGGGGNGKAEGENVVVKAEHGD